MFQVLDVSITGVSSQEVNINYKNKIAKRGDIIVFT